jgi:hypothetical protein
MLPSPYLTIHKRRKNISQQKIDRYLIQQKNMASAQYLEATKRKDVFGEKKRDNGKIKESRRE